MHKHYVDPNSHFYLNGIANLTPKCWWKLLNCYLASAWSRTP
jgi:hypothetical protein